MERELHTLFVVYGVISCVMQMLMAIVLVGLKIITNIEQGVLSIAPESGY